MKLPHKFKIHKVKNEPKLEPKSIADYQYEYYNASNSEYQQQWGAVQKWEDVQQNYNNALSQVQEQQSLNPANWEQKANGQSSWQQGNPLGLGAYADLAGLAGQLGQSQSGLIGQPWPTWGPNAQPFQYEPVTYEPVTQIIPAGELRFIPAEKVALVDKLLNGELELVTKVEIQTTIQHRGRKFKG